MDVTSDKTTAFENGQRWLRELKDHADRCASDLFCIGTARGRLLFD